jgi:hypothetical protein
MRELKYALNLPTVIGQTPSREITATEQSASPSLQHEAGNRCFHWAAHIQPFFLQRCQRPSDPLLRFDGLMSAPCPLWVKSGHGGTSDQRPLYPQKRTSLFRARSARRL